ncbi:MAG: hypothetical protein KDE20_03430 [Caldilineaceae bacterium]|nr:hypothetical protein [Caldilineaceae bacterium]
MRRIIAAGSLALMIASGQCDVVVHAQDGAVPPAVATDAAAAENAATDSAAAEDPSTDAGALDAAAPLTATVPLGAAEDDPGGDGTAHPAAAAVDLPAWRLLSPPYSDPTPLPASGMAMYYNPGVMKTVIESRQRFDHIEPCAECIGYVAMLRYGDLDRKVWLQTGPLTVEGPFHVVDAAATQHVDQLLARDWVVDVDYRTAQRWGFRMPWVTVWDEPPLELLLATDAMPLDWDACRPPTNAFIHSPHSVSVADTLVVVPDQTVKKAIELRHLGAMDFVDAMSDAPDYLYVK